LKKQRNNIFLLSVS